MQDGGESINFSYRGVDYSIDLTDKEGLFTIEGVVGV